MRGLSTQGLSTAVRRFGAAHEVVEVEAAGMPRPGTGEVVVRMGLSAVNPSDLVTIAGAYRTRTPLPFRPGYEGVGTVVAVGPGVEDLRPGSRVLPIGTPGSWATHKVAEARWCFPVSDDIALEQAATMYVNPCTAWLMLHDRAAIRPGLRVIVSAAASEIGVMLVRMLNRAGLAPVVTVRRPDSAARLAGLAVERVLVGTPADFAPDLADVVRQGGADLVLDAVGGEVGLALSTVVRPGGQFIHYGLLSGVPLPPETWQRAPGIRFEMFWLRNWIHRQPRAEIEALLRRVEALIRSGTVASQIDSVFPLDEIGAALARVGSARRRGKVLLQP